MAGPGYGGGIRSIMAVTSAVASSATVVTISEESGAVQGRSIFNDSTQVLYLKMGSGASASDHGVQLAAGAYFEVPFAYKGIITGLWASANGNARVTEYQ